MMKRLILTAALITLSLTYAQAQQTTNTPGLPGATTTIDGKQLPPLPDKHFGGKIGPYDQWPLGLGFDYFFGFMGGDTSQWQPGNLVRNTTYIHPYEDDPDWNLVTAMADDAIEYMQTVDALNPDQPCYQPRRLDPQHQGHACAVGQQRNGR